MDESADPPRLNEETPQLDAAVAVEWWHRFDDDGEPVLDTHHGFHDAVRVATDAPPAVQEDEFVTASGARVTEERDSGDVRDCRYLYISHEEALARDLTPCVECFPRYATEQRLAEAREEGGMLTEAGVEGAVFPIWTRFDKDSEWDLDSVHESYTSLLYRAAAIRDSAGSVGDRLRYSFRPIRQCEYESFDDAATVEPSMAHVSDLRPVQPEELSEVSARLGEDLLSTVVQHEHRQTNTGKARASLVHRAETPPGGFEREAHLGIGEDADDAFQEILDSEQQTVADVIDRGNAVEFCDACFPELATWGAGSGD